VGKIHEYNGISTLQFNGEVRAKKNIILRQESHIISKSGFVSRIVSFKGLFFDVGGSMIFSHDSKKCRIIFYFFMFELIRSNL
jgi:hypothetical protein